MIHHLFFYKLKSDIEPLFIDELVRVSRSTLLRIREVYSIRSGKNIEPNSQWHFFVSIEVSSLEKLKIFFDDPYYLKFSEKIIKPNIVNQFNMTFELDPSKNIKYS